MLLSTFTKEIGFDAGCLLLKMLVKRFCVIPQLFQDSISRKVLNFLVDVLRSHPGCNC